MQGIDLRSKYLVPFSYDSVQFDKLHEKDSSWVIKDSSKEIESDVYEYVRKSFITSSNEDDDHSIKIGCLYEYKSKALSGNFKVKYIHEGYSLQFRINQVMLALFQTGIGFIWFQPVVDGGFKNVEEAIDFNYHIKEMARDEKNNYLFKEEVFDITGDEDISEKDIIPGGKKYKKNMPFYLGVWIDDIVRSISRNITYYPSRTMSIDDERRILPDKFVLFQCGIIEQSTDVVQSIVYLTKGYKSSYQLVEDIETQIFKPFENVRYYASSEGCGFFAIGGEKTPDFFRSGLTKISNDYYMMYLLALYQNYTLLRYSDLISNKLSSDRYDYKRYSKKLEENLDDITTELNVFLAKSVYSSVSHIQHQNEFFNYVSDRLLIRENIKSVTAGIEALNNIEGCLYEEEVEKKNKYLNFCLTVVSGLALFSAFNDINELLINHIYRILPTANPILTYLFNGVLLLITLVITGKLIQYIIYDPDRHKNKKQARAVKKP